MKITSVNELEDFRSKIQSDRDPDRPRIIVCGGTGCHASGCTQVASTFEESLKSGGLADRVDLVITGCHGFCERGPIVIIYPQGIFYQKVTPDDVGEIINTTVENGGILERLQYKDPVTNEVTVHEEDIPFYQKQKRLILGNNTSIDPTNIKDYIAVGGYSALAKVLGSTPEAVIDEVKKSGLRGRGGGGFPTGLKLESTRSAPGDVKYVICNADEGDPGAYMDRSILEGNPHSVLEGIIIGAYAIGANEGYIYVRNEYPLAVANITIAIRQARENQPPLSFWLQTQRPL